jgi:hypothetical protein
MPGCSRTSQSVHARCWEGSPRHPILRHRSVCEICAPTPAHLLAQATRRHAHAERGKLQRASTAGVAQLHNTTTTERVTGPRRRAPVTGMGTATPYRDGAIQHTSAMEATHGGHSPEDGIVPQMRLGDGVPVDDPRHGVIPAKRESSSAAQSSATAAPSRGHPRGRQHATIALHAFGLAS